MSTKKQSHSGENRRQFLKKSGTAAAAVAALKVPVYGAGQAPSATLHHDGVWTEAFHCSIDNRREQL